MRARNLFWSLVAVGVATGALARDPVLKLERLDPADDGTWNAQSPLSLHATVRSLSTRDKQSDADFGVDSSASWTNALRVLVTDATGKSVDWPFVRAVEPKEASLDPASVTETWVRLDFDPRSGHINVPAGRYRVRAQLDPRSGSGHAKIESKLLTVEVVRPPAPELRVVGFEDGTLVRGWPCLIGVSLSASELDEVGLPAPTTEKGWADAMSLTLLNSDGNEVALPLAELPLIERADPVLQPGEAYTLWFRMPSTSTESLGEGSYRWVAKYTRPVNNTESSWSGSAVASVPIRLVTAPANPMPQALAKRYTWSQVDDALAEVTLLRKTGTGGGVETNVSSTIALQLAALLVRAERLAAEWLNAHPDDPKAALLMATVMRAQEDRHRAIKFTNYAIEVELRKRTGTDAQASPSFLLMQQVRELESLPEGANSEVLRTALAQEYAHQPPIVLNLPRTMPEPAISLSAAQTKGAATTSVPPAIALAPVTAQSIVASAPETPKQTVARLSPAVSVVPTAELNDAKIIADPAGQWAASATAGTKYGKTQYSPAQATGAPNISTAGNSPDAWSPENKTGGTDWLEVTFAKPVHATEVRVRQNDSVGAIAKIEAIESDGTTHVWWEGVDPYKAPAVREIVWFAVRVPQTTYLVAKVKVTLNLSATPGWKEIDAVQLVGAAP